MSETEPTEPEPDEVEWRASLSTCAYYRGVGTCSFGCYSEPGCWELGPPNAEDRSRWQAAGLTYAEETT